MAMGAIEIIGERVRLRPILPEEIEQLRQAMLAESDQAVAKMPEEASFRRRLTDSGHLGEGTLDLAIEVGGLPVGRVQTFVPPDRPDASRDLLYRNWLAANRQRSGLRAGRGRAAHRLAL